MPCKSWQPVTETMPAGEEPVIIALRSKHNGQWIVGEAYRANTVEFGRVWCWANTTPEDRSIGAQIGVPELWQPMPAPPE